MTVRVDTQEKEFRVDNVQGPWDVTARLRDVFAFVQDNLRGTDVDLREVEYAACNGMLHTLDPHTVLLSPEAYKEMNLSTQRAVRRPRHRHLDPRSAAHRHEPDAGHAGRARGRQEVRPHHEDQRRVDAQHGPQRRRASTCAARPARRSPSGSTATAPTAGRARSRSSSTREIIQVASRRAQAARRQHRLRAPQAVPGEHLDRARRGARRHEEAAASSRASSSICAATRAACSIRRRRSPTSSSPRGPSSRRSATRAKGARRRRRTARAPSRTIRSRCS